MFVQPDWSKIHKELAIVCTNLKLLHAEYSNKQPDWHAQLGASGDAITDRIVHNTV